MRKYLSFIICGVLCLSVAETETGQTIQAPIWVYLETVPGSYDAKTVPEKEPPIQELDSIARLILSGMIYGWRFSYTPSDKTRQVEESFSLEPIGEITKGDTNYALKQIRPAYPRLSCWAQYTIDEKAARWESYWDSVLFTASSGRGQGERTRETAGIRDAYTTAIQAAIREYARKQIKNKPKELRGEVLLSDEPRLFVQSGYFIADVRILINLQEIIPYRNF